MNFVINSPHFPETYWRFAEALKKNGFTVLGIGDAPYNEISSELKSVLNEYYFCPRMDDYSELYKAFAFLSSKYGKIDWVESNNEYWLAKDAKLRTDFNLKTGVCEEDIIAYKSKTAMKEYYKQAKVKFARHLKTGDLALALKFVKKVGYPLFAKPDIGVGANSTYRLNNEEELNTFFSKKDVGDYIIEEYIDGTIVSFDGIANSKYEPVICVQHLFPVANADVVGGLLEDYYYSLHDIDEDLLKAGKSVLKAFKVYKRFFHLEFFRLNADKKGLGKKGDLVALEVNMRPPGGYTTDMISACLGMSSYAVYADVIAFDENRQVSSTKPMV
ncbi:MAG TPA: carbamoylphosphate synthase large subunit, partial [Bacilli bacterium]|nr:carbamoylphosphate synthase large subunit [Bacilli bacterium]